MKRVTYDQAKADHAYLWGISPAYDMTGGYEDQNDLRRMLEKPTKATARACYVDQIVYWFSVGPGNDWHGNELNYDGRKEFVKNLIEEDERSKLIFQTYTR